MAGTVRSSGRALALATVAALALAADLAPGPVGAEDPVVQRQMATSFGEQLGLSADEAQPRLDRQDRLVTVADRIRERLGGAYAGIWFDQADDGRMKVGIAAATSDADPGIVRAVRAILVADHATGDADVVRVAETEAQLEARQDRLDAALASAMRTGQVATGIDAATNAVVVRVARSASAATRADAARAVDDVGGSVRIESSAASAWSFDAGDREIATAGRSRRST